MSQKITVYNDTDNLVYISVSNGGQTGFFRVKSNGNKTWVRPLGICLIRVRDPRTERDYDKLEYNVIYGRNVIRFGTDYKLYKIYKENVVLTSSNEKLEDLQKLNKDNLQLQELEELNKLHNEQIQHLQHLQHLQSNHEELHKYEIKPSPIQFPHIQQNDQLEEIDDETLSNLKMDIKKLIDNCDNYLFLLKIRHIVRTR